jgi:hypothetical protein
VLVHFGETTRLGRLTTGAVDAYVTARLAKKASQVKGF